MAIVGKAGKMIIIGIEEKNVEKLKEGKPFHLFGEEVGLLHDIIIFYAETYDDLLAIVNSHTGPETTIIDNRHKKGN